MRAMFARSKSPQRAPSPTFSDATNASAINFGLDGPQKIITRANLKASLQAYEQLMATSAAYRAALITMSNATAAFADAMAVCASLKGPSYEAGTRFQVAGGLHHLIGNQYHVLAETLDKKFEKPLRQHLETYRTIVTERSATYERALREKSQIIRETETRNMNRKERNLQRFREVLAVLQRQVDELDELKASHYQEIVEHEEEVWDVVQAKICLVVRSSMDVFDRFTAKASDPVIEPMLQAVPDPFDSYGPPQAEDQIFSILNPLSIMTTTTPSPITMTPELETIDGLPSTRWTVDNFNGSTTPRSLSPPSSTKRYSPSTHPTHRSRKSESKLRDSVSAADEVQTGLNGGTLRAPKPQPSQSITDFPWSSPFEPLADREEETPRLEHFPPSQITPSSSSSDVEDAEDTAALPIAP